MDEYQPSYEEYPSESDKRIEELEKENKKIMGDVEIWKQNRFNLFQRLELYEMTRKEVAKEIFEEIEKIIASHEITIGLVFDEATGAAVAIGRIDRKIAEFKKEYTEGGE